MRSTPRLVPLLFFAAAIAVSADDIDDRLASAAAQMASDDPAERDRGEAALLEVAGAAGSRLRMVLAHADAEVRARSERALRGACILPEQGKTGRLKELFLAFSKDPVEGSEEDRTLAARELLDLHPWAVDQVARELSEGALTPGAPDFQVMAPGRVEAVLEAVNEGPTGAWFRPDSGTFSPTFTPFGRRPHRFRCGGCRGHRMPSPFALENESPLDSAARYLAGLVRVGPGEKRGVARGSGEFPRCGTVAFTLLRDDEKCEPFTVQIGDALLCFPESTAHQGGTWKRALLASSTGTGFSVQPFSDDEGRGLEVVAVKDHAAFPNAFFDNFWWVATDAEGRVLDTNAFCSEEADLAEWKAGEKRLVRMRTSPPPGTRTLWMGMSTEAEDVVPAPVALDEK